MESVYLTLNKNRIHYWRFGRGEKRLVALHGFGDSGRIFLPLAAVLKNDFQVYAPDLPYHGKTVWNESEFTREDMMAIIEGMLNSEEKGTFSVLGYSFGGRIVLSMLPGWEEGPETVFLVAPDGLQTRGMQLPEMFPVTLRAWFASGLERPDWLLHTAEKLFRLKLLSAPGYSFLRQNLSSPDRRKRLIQTWVSLKNFPVSRDELRAFLNENTMPVFIGSAKEDKIVPGDSLKKIVENIPNVIHRELNGDHDQLINAGLASWLVDVIKGMDSDPKKGS